MAANKANQVSNLIDRDGSRVSLFCHSAETITGVVGGYMGRAKKGAREGPEEDGAVAYLVLPSAGSGKVLNRATRLSNRRPARRPTGKTGKRWTKIGAAFPHKEGPGGERLLSL